MFKFNFNVEENEEKKSSSVIEDENSLTNQEFGCFYLDDSDELSVNEEENRRKFETFSSDLVPNIYEGKTK